MEDRVLIHWGNKGQKWGVRNYRNYDGTLTDAGRERYDYYDNKTDRVYRTGRLKQLGAKTYNKTNRWGVLQENLSKYTNDELKALTERANLEKDYRSAFNTTQYTKGKRFIEGIKRTAVEVADIANAGKKLIDGINGIRKSLLEAQGYDEKIAREAAKEQERATKKAAKEAEAIVRKSNDKAAKDWLLTINNYKQREYAMEFLNKFGGRKSDYGNITPDQLNMIKQLYGRRSP